MRSGAPFATSPGKDTMSTSIRGTAYFLIRGSGFCGTLARRSGNWLCQRHLHEKEWHGRR